MKRLAIPLFLCAVLAIALVAVPVPSIVVTAPEGKRLHVARVGSGDTVRVAHTNSIYDEKVEEVLEVRGERLVVTEVKTPSYGVREYYRITDAPPILSLRSFRFYNTITGRFELWIKGKSVDLNRCREKLVSVEIYRITLFRYLLLLVLSACR